jgi:2-keto-4-pentenoate hydratase
MDYSINGVVQGSATGVEVMGNPLHAVALVANKIGAAGGTLKAGMVVMTGSLIANLPVAPGDHLQVEFTRLGRVQARFVA